MNKINLTFLLLSSIINTSFGFDKVLELSGKLSRRAVKVVTRKPHDYILDTAKKYKENIFIEKNKNVCFDVPNKEPSLDLPKFRKFAQNIYEAAPRIDGITNLDIICEDIIDAINWVGDDYKEKTNILNEKSLFSLATFNYQFKMKKMERPEIGYTASVNYYEQGCAYSKSQTNSSVSISSSIEEISQRDAVDILTVSYQVDRIKNILDKTLKLYTTNGFNPQNYTIVDLINGKHDSDAKKFYEFYYNNEDENLNVIN